MQQVGAVRALEQSLTSRSDTGVAERLAERLAAVEPERELDQAARCGIRFLVPGDPEWPPGLDRLDDTITDDGFGGTPPGLWVRGPMSLRELDCSVAVVGSRAASFYGVEMTRAVCADLAHAGVPVVSGGALGIDFVAHDSTLAAAGSTVAVLACGVDRVYPAQNRRLLQHLAAQLAVVSEQPPGSTPTRPRFLARNRLIAAMTTGTVLVEAALRSGALNTAGWAEGLGRQVMCVPGPVTSATSQGVNHFLREGRGTVVTSGREVLELVAGRGSTSSTRPAARPAARRPHPDRAAGGRVGAGEPPGPGRRDLRAVRSPRAHHGRCPAAAPGQGPGPARRGGLAARA